MGVREPSEQKFRDLYRAHYGFVWHALRRFGVAPPDVDDATQDTFIVAYRRREDFREGGSTKAWLYGIARRVAANRRRSMQRRARKRRAATIAPSAPAGEDAREALRLVEGYLESLQTRDRELFVLSQLEGMTGREIAEALRTRPSTAYGRLEVLRREIGALVGRDTLARARTGRPRATSRGWALLVPALRTQSSTVPWWSALLPAKKAMVIGVTATATVAVASVTIETNADPTAVAALPGPKRPQGSPANAALPREAAPPAPEAALTTEAPLEVAPTPEVATPEAAPSDRATATPAAQRAPATQRARPAPDLGTSSLTRENELLRSARAAARRHRYDEALTLTNAHADEFPESVLADMRAAVRIEALCGSGKQQRGKQEASAWLRRRPGSPMAERIRHACDRGIGNSPSPGQGDE